MSKFYNNILIGVALLTTFIQATPVVPEKRLKRSLLQALFGAAPITTTEAPLRITTPEVDMVMEFLESGEPVYLMPTKQDPENPPTFIPMMPLRYFASPSGLHFIAVEPINFTPENQYIQHEGAEQQWQPNYIPVTSKNVPTKINNNIPPHLKGLSSSEIRELNVLAKQIGVENLDDLPPLEEVMSLLGTTTKSETIEAIREYASTPTGLDLIRDYVMSYQPVKRMDTVRPDGQFDEKKSIEMQGKYPSENMMYVNHPVPIIGYTIPSEQQPMQKPKPTSEAPNQGLFSRLRSYLGFGSHSQPAEEVPNPNILVNGQSEFNLIPHIVIPLRHWAPMDGSSGYALEDLQHYPMTPLIQDTSPYVLKPETIQYASINAPVYDSMDPKLNEAHIYQDDVHNKQDIKDEASIANQKPVRISPPEEQTGQLHKADIDKADLPLTIKSIDQAKPEIITPEPTTEVIATENVEFNETTEPMTTDGTVISENI
ncbi:uncharacterized protein LOC135704448 [Ochlerotatus camptorhynchus]|uniref:uncharacterized protein LOC135704448 n=1 Tax=Ochlerotatus camptorhynchus TaxID=644619 RepID=UPI0031DCEF87